MSVLYLVPTPIFDNTIKKVLPDEVITFIHNLKQFIVEDIRTARRFLAKIRHPVKFDQLQFHELNEHTTTREKSLLLNYIFNEDTGLMSEAGLPCLADPGAEIVRLAHANSITVVPLTGPSSIFLALIASGLNGQSFSFIGYLPVKQNERISYLHEIEKRSKMYQQTQIFIETPYRNMSLLEDIINCCNPETKLTIAASITSPYEKILTKSIIQWKQGLPDLKKIPTVFLLQASF
ncbi:MAG: SAM-dependent methyltransferase [Firmicutes bacterium]|nr:SAM-dependent methyltransferase [Bacillota bacterium]